ncbi:hypothetical protein BH20ACT2_BH20ACT2_08140 [soil metagenome]
MSIRFDHATAEEAVRQLELTVQSLLGMVEVLEADLPIVTEEWRGRFRHTFDYESARHDVSARTLANTLHLAAVGIRAKQFEAQGAQRLEAAVDDDGGGG